MASFERVTAFTSPEFSWFHHPESWEVEDVDGETEGSAGKVIELTAGKIVFRAPAKKDFWSRTFYTPLLIKSDASGYLIPIKGDREATVAVDFDLNPISQFDQAGLLVYVDDNYWVKCGIEYCDGLARLSVVVCNAGFSDWSTQVWSSTSGNPASARLRVHKILQSSSLVIEAAHSGTDDFHFVRIAHLGGVGVVASDATTFPDWRVGPFAACPISQKGCAATFTNFCAGPREETTHSSSL